MMKKALLALLLAMIPAGKALGSQITSSCSADQFELLCSGLTGTGVQGGVGFFATPSSVTAVSTFVYVNGRLGLGVSNPSQQIELTGNILVGNEGFANIWRSEQYFLAPNTGSRFFNLNSAGASFGVMQNDKADFWSFGYAGSLGTGLGTSVLGWGANGRVGVGTTTPSVPLEVVGAARIDDGTALTGYVFTAQDNQGTGAWAPASGGSVSGTAGQLPRLNSSNSVVSSTSGYWDGAKFGIYGSTITESRVVLAPASLIGGGSNDGEVFVHPGDDPTGNGIGGRVTVLAGNSNGVNGGGTITEQGGDGGSSGPGGDITLTGGRSTAGSNNGFGAVVSVRGGNGGNGGNFQGVAGDGLGNTNAGNAILQAGAAGSAGTTPGDVILKGGNPFGSSVHATVDVGSADVTIASATVHVLGNVPTGAALCLNASGQLSVCTSVISVLGACTCP